MFIATQLQVASNFFFALWNSTFAFCRIRHVPSKLQLSRINRQLPITADNCPPSCRHCPICCLSKIAKICAYLLLMWPAESHLSSLSICHCSNVAVPANTAQQPAAQQQVAQQSIAPQLQQNLPVQPPLHQDPANQGRNTANHILEMQLSSWSLAGCRLAGRRLVVC
jgi:hypothetical protein